VAIGYYQKHNQPDKAEVHRHFVAQRTGKQPASQVPEEKQVSVP
jgi:hypothetical protein